MRWVRFIILAGLAQATCGLSGCALDPKLQKWESDFYYTERLYIDGQHALAAQRFEKLRAQAKDPRDADEAALMVCEVQSRGGKPLEAAACYDHLATSAYDRPVRMRALLHAAELRYYELNRVADALVLWTKLLERAPDEPATLRALDHVYLHGETDRSKRLATIALFERMEHADPRSELADNLLLRQAMLLDLEGTPDGWQKAVAVLERQERDHAADATFVDCLMLRSRVYRKLGNLKMEARDLERLVDTFETSYVFASYSVDEHKTASARLIELYRGPLLNLPRAELHARNLPAMLRRPVYMPRYLVTLAEVQEARGQRVTALGTYRDVLSFVTTRNQDYRENDRRICRELPTDGEQHACRQTVDAMSDVEPKECNVARERIARLQDEMRRPQLDQPSVRRPGGTP